MSEKIEHLFTCKKCRSHDLWVEHEYTITNNYTQTLPCNCGGTNDGIAAEYDFHVLTSYRDWGLLDEEHRWEKQESEKLDVQVEDDNLQVFCDECHEAAAEDG